LRVYLRVGVTEWFVFYPGAHIACRCDGMVWFFRPRQVLGVVVRMSFFALSYPITEPPYVCPDLCS